MFSKILHYIVKPYVHTIIHCFVSTQNFTFPEGVALPIGGEDRIHTHVLLEMHYDNPEEISG